MYKTEFYYKFDLNSNTWYNIRLIPDEWLLTRLVYCEVFTEKNDICYYYVAQVVKNRLDDNINFPGYDTLFDVILDPGQFRCINKDRFLHPENYYDKNEQNRKGMLISVLATLSVLYFDKKYTDAVGFNKSTTISPFGSRGTLIKEYNCINKFWKL